MALQLSFDIYIWAIVKNDSKCCCHDLKYSHTNIHAPSKKAICYKISLSLSLFCFGYICDSFRGEGEGYFVTNCFFRWCMYVCMRIFQTMTTTLWITFYNHSSISNDNCKTITFKRVNSWLINMGPNLVRMSYKLMFYNIQ